MFAKATLCIILTLSSTFGALAAPAVADPGNVAALASRQVDNNPDLSKKVDAKRPKSPQPDDQQAPKKSKKDAKTTTKKDRDTNVDVSDGSKGGKPKKTLTTRQVDNPDWSKKLNPKPQSTRPQSPRPQNKAPPRSPQPGTQRGPKKSEAPGVPKTENDRGLIDTDVDVFDKAKGKPKPLW